MKKYIAIIGLALQITACDFFNSEIDAEKVNADDSTHIYTFKEDNKKVTGTVVFYELDPRTSKKFKHSIRELQDGKRINKGYDYYPNGTISVEYSYDQNGMISGTIKTFYPDGKVGTIAEYKDNKQSGITKNYREDGTQAREVLFEAGTQLKAYDFDQSGKKIIPPIERLELVTFKTGYFEYIDYNSNQVLYQPMVIMKWRNKSEQPISEIIKIEGVFIDNSKQEEMAKATNYFQGITDAPLQPNLSRQGVLQSSVGYTNVSGIYGSNISCQIIVDNQLFKTVKIDNEELTTNRIQ